MNFANLRELTGTFPLAESRELAARRLRELFLKSRFCLYHPGDPIVASGYRVLYGACSWVPSTLDFLDRLHEKISDIPIKSLVVDVFDIDVCHSPEDLREYIPESLVTIPVAGLWIDGKLVERAHAKLVEERVLSWVEMAQKVGELARIRESRLKSQGPLI